MNLTVSFMNTANRAWRSARFHMDTTRATDTIYIGKTATLVAVKEAEIECKFYTPRGSQLQNPRCIVNFHEYGIYRTSNFAEINAPDPDPRNVES